MSIKVLKFGGSSFLDCTDYRRVAEYVAGRTRSYGDKVIVVVSAMSGTTGNLQSLALGINSQIARSTLDATLATGEMLSACLLEAAVGNFGVKVRSLFGYSLGVRTDSDFSRASVKQIDTTPLTDAIEQNDVVVVAGGQAVDRAGRLTMLGRNSSDFSAVIIAAAVGCDSCEIFSDVSGVYTADPYLIPNAQLIPEISHDLLSQMSRRGAKVLHYKAIEHAKKHGIAIICKSLQESEIVGTCVGPGSDAKAVVLDQAATLLHFQDLDARARAQNILENLDLTGVLVGHSICLSHDAEFAIRKLTDIGHGPEQVSTTPLVTEVTPAGQRSKFQPDLESAVNLAQQIHTQLFPNAKERPLDLDAIKPRSKYSGVLTRCQTDQKKSRRSDNSLQVIDRK